MDPKMAPKLIQQLVNIWIHFWIPFVLRFWSSSGASWEPSWASGSHLENLEGHDVATVCLFWAFHFSRYLGALKGPLGPTLVALGPILDRIWSPKSIQKWSKKCPKTGPKNNRNITNKMRFWGPDMDPKMSPSREAQAGRFQDGGFQKALVFKLGLRWPKTASRWPNMEPRWPKMEPRWPKMAPRWPKIAPRWPRIIPRWLNIAPTWPQEGPKLAQDGPKMA